MDDKTRYQQGMNVRRKVLGDAHVERTLHNLTPLNDEFQDFITRYAWGETWTRPGLDHHTRSMITIAMLIALNRETELKMHLRAAFNNGVTRDELKELIMHSALYCGLPAVSYTHLDVYKRQVEQCSYPLTGVGCVSRIYTDLAVIDITPALSLIHI